MILLVEMDKDYLASDAGVTHVGEISIGYWLVILENKWKLLNEKNTHTLT